MKKKSKIKKKAVQAKVSEGKPKLIMWLSLIIFISSFFLYANTFRNDYALDDFSVIKENWVVKKGAESIPLIFKTSYRYGYWSSADELYRPLSLVMFAAEWEIWPGNPKPGHVINVLLYGLVCVLIFTTMRKLLSSSNLFLPFLITVLFAFHPVHTEVVANIKSRDELLCSLFLILSLRFTYNYINTSAKKWLLAGMASYFLAFMAKESAITFLAVYPLVIYYFTDAPMRKNLFFSAMMLIPAFLFLAIRNKVLANQPDVMPVSVVDNLLVAAPDIVTKLATAVKILGKYLLLLVYPYPLVADYSYNQIPVEGWGSLRVLASFAIFAFMAVYAVLKFRKKDLLSFSVIFFFVTISIYSNIVFMIGSSFGERFLFLPSLSYCILIAFLLTRLTKTPALFPITGSTGAFFRTYKRPFLIIMPVLLLYSVVVISRNKEWENDLIRNTADVRKSPDSAHMRYYYGLDLMKEKALNKNGEVVSPEWLDSAILNFKIAAEIVPAFADAYDQAGLAFYRKGMNDSALKYYGLALKYNPSKPITYSNMGIIYFNMRQYDKALEVYEKAVKYDPHFADAWLNLGSTLGTLGRFDEAINAFKKSVEYKPDNAIVYYFIGITYRQAGDEANAKIYLDKAANLDPKYRQ